MGAASDSRFTWRAVGNEWWPVAVGLFALYVPVFYELAHTIWQEEDNAHGPVILAILLWLVWDRRDSLSAANSNQSPILGFVLLISGLAAYVLGTSQGITLLAVGSLVPVLAGVLVGLRGWRGVKALWFVLLFVAYLIPLPGAFIWEMTGTLKQMVSQLTTAILYLAGYPIARSGVTLTIGQYQLLVGTACSGINSMFSLSAIGLLYLYVMKRKGILHNGLILASLLPIAFVTNVVRVIFLVLLTYYFGDEVGQGFLHKFSGMLIFISALLLIFFLDRILVRVLKPDVTVG